jgi:hypothetical protein
MLSAIVAHVPSFGPRSLSRQCKVHYCICAWILREQIFAHTMSKMTLGASCAGVVALQPSATYSTQLHTEYSMTGVDSDIL